MWFELLKDAEGRALELLEGVIRDAPHAKWLDNTWISLTPDWLPMELSEVYAISDVNILRREIERTVGTDYFRRYGPIFEGPGNLLWTMIDRQMHITEILVQRDSRNCLKYVLNQKGNKIAGMVGGSRALVSDYPILVDACFNPREQKGDLPNDDIIAGLVLAAGEKSTWRKIWE
jgi:hypothetical protein